MRAAISCTSVRPTCDDADVPALKRAGVRVGISTHSHEELERALTFESRLRRARADLSDDVESDAVGAAGVWSVSRNGSVGLHRSRWSLSVGSLSSGCRVFSKLARIARLSCQMSFGTLRHELRAVEWINATRDAAAR